VYLVSLGLAATSSPADAARAAGCDSLVPLHFPGGIGSTVLEGTVPRSGRACWTVRLEAGRQLDLRLSSAEGGAKLEVRSQAGPSVQAPGGAGSVTSSSISGSSAIASAGGGETRVSAGSVTSSSISGSSAIASAGGGEARVSVGPQRSSGKFLLAVGAAHGSAASYRLEITLR
jgi:hypothetical protein